MIYLLFFWIVCLTFVVIILYLESRVKKEEGSMYYFDEEYLDKTAPNPLHATVSTTNTAPQFVEFLGADRVNDILSEKVDPKIDDILI
jgi:hypothetical protein